MSSFTRTVICINASNQPALELGRSYLVVVQVDAGAACRDGEERPVKGLMVMLVDENRALPYIYDRTRFAEASSDEGRAAARFSN